MLNHEINQKLESIFGSMDAVHPFLPERIDVAYSLILSLSAHFESILFDLREYDFDSGKNYEESKWNYHDSMNKLLSTFNTRRVFVALNEFIELIQSLGELDREGLGYILQLGDSVESFSDCYDEYLKESDFERAFLLMKSAYETKIEISACFPVLYSFYRILSGSLEGSSESESSDLAPLTILLPFRDDFAGVLQRLSAIRKLYEEVCGLLGVSSDAKPLKLGKIESGSLWVKLFGEPKAVNLIVRFVEEGAGYIYRKFTSEGQISSIPRKVESLDRVVRLRASLREVGIDTHEMDDQIAKSAVVIAKNLNVLLERQSSVNINGRITSVSDEMLKVEIESHPWPQLEHIDASETEDRNSETKES